MFFLLLLALTLSIDNWAVIVGASRYWYNYRHSANALAVYRTVKSLGIPDERIILMLAGEIGCDARNPFRGQVFFDNHLEIDLYGSDIEIDYSGLDCNVENLLRVMTGRHSKGALHATQLKSSSNSNILFYLTGHGGDSILKFHDNEEIHSQDLANALSLMWQQNRYNEVLFIVDACESESVVSAFSSPNIISLTSARASERSYGFHRNIKLGVAVADLFTSSLVRYISKMVPKDESNRIINLLRYLKDEHLDSHPTLNHELLAKRDIEEVLLSDFFAFNEKVVKLEDVYPLSDDHITELQGQLADIWLSTPGQPN